MQEKQPPPAGSRPRRWRPLAGVALCLAAVVLGGRVAASALTVLGAYELSWGQFKGITRPAPGHHEYLTSSPNGC